MDNLEYFSQTLNKFKDGPKAVSWGSHASQQVRFEVLAEIGNMKGASVLDFGCGLGDLYPYLKSLGIKSYVGYDINKDMILAAGKKHKTNFTTIFPRKRFDWVLASGVFNIPIQNWLFETYYLVLKMYFLCKKGVAVNFLSNVARDSFPEHSYFADPFRMSLELSNISNKFVLRHDYKNNDFTIYLLR